MPKESLYKSSDKAVRVLKSTLFGSLREYLFWIVFLVASRAWGSKLFLQNHNCGPELGSLACASPHPLLHVYFNYSLHFASNFHHEPPPPPLHIPHSNHTSLLSAPLFFLLSLSLSLTWKAPGTEDKLVTGFLLIENTFLSPHASLSLLSPCPCFTL